MKKKFTTTLIGMLILGGVYSHAQEPIGLGTHYDDPGHYGPGHTKAPVLPPSLWQEGHQILFEANHADYTLSIVQDGEVVYSTFVPSSTTLVTLPSWLSGDCEILLNGDTSYYFYGFINL